MEQPVAREGQQGRWVVPTLVLVTVAAVLVRWVGLSTQSLWSDESFSFRQTEGDLARVLRIGNTEVHPPSYAVVLWWWKSIVGLGWLRARALSALVTSVAVLLIPLVLRRTTITQGQRWVLAAVLACSPLGLVHGQDIRSYGMLWGLSVLVTVAHLGLEIGRRERWRWVVWAVAALLAAAVHLFGLLLAASSLLVLVVRGRTGWRRGLLLGAVIAGPQLAWLAHGLTVDGFAAGAQFVRPSTADLLALAMSSFGVGRPTLQSTGMNFTSPIGLALAVLVLALAVGSRDRAPLRPPTPAQRQGRAAALGLLAVALIAVVLTWTVSQWVHLWTLRNMLVVEPALRTALVLTVAFGSSRAQLRRRLATLLVGLQCVALVSVAVGNLMPWKPDTRAAVDYLIALRRDEPQVKVWGNSSASWALGTRADRPSPVVVKALTPDVVIDRLTYPYGARKISEVSQDTVFIMYYHVSADTTEQMQLVLVRLGGGRCVPLGIHGLIAVRCTPA